RYFESDRLGIRTTMRIGFGYPHEQAIVRIGADGS
ncbi:phage major capsid protein, partial [Mycobacteroides abscessus subsp. abscessus]|nr:phage major capsid protein [Mycobacteroides abscessus subsp. abscessus]